MIVQQIEQVRREHGVGQIKELCRSAGLPPASYYRLRGQLDEPEGEADVELRSAIQRIAMDWPSYGYRRITAELGRQGIVANHKLVLRLMRQDNLLCLRKRRFALTSGAGQKPTAYPNRTAERTLTGLNQLWVADLTYIRLRREFIYLGVVLDAFSRRVIGWALSRRLEAELAVSALRKALAIRCRSTSSDEPLLHHSDRGVQYASLEYTALLDEHGIGISMSRPATPTDNAKAESFMKTLKYEEVLLNDYSSMEEARSSIGHFLDRIYNEQRLHSALGYAPPVEFEASLLNPSTTP